MKTVLKKSEFSMILGISPELKVIEYLIKNQEYDLTPTDIAKKAHINRQRSYEIMENLKQHNIVFQRRIIGKCKFYILNKENKVVKLLIKLIRIEK